MVTPSLEETKDQVKSLDKMKVGQFFFCDCCDKPIYDKKKGYVVHGNIYHADPTSRTGLIGNNFPKVVPGELIKVEDVKEHVYCTTCLLLSLNIEKPKEKTKAKVTQSYQQYPKY